MKINLSLEAKSLICFRIFWFSSSQGNCKSFLVLDQPYLCPGLQSYGSKSKTIAFHGHDNGKISTCKHRKSSNHIKA